MSHAYVQESVVSNEGAKDREVGEFLSCLPPDTPVYRYNKQGDLDTLFPKSPLVEDYTVVLTNLASITLDEIEEELPGRSEFSTTLEILIVTMPSQPHEEGADSFGVIISTLAKSMNVYRRIANCGATRVRLDDREKQADRSWKPAHQGREFPTVALEVGYSETAAKLENDMSRWIHSSNGDVKMGITIDIKRGSDNIEIKSWALASPPPPKRVYITARNRPVMDRHFSQQLNPQLVQRILIKRGQSGNHSIEGKDLVIPFESLLLTQPGEGEGDFIITTEMLLEDLAERIWAAIDDVKMIKESVTAPIRTQGPTRNRSRNVCM